MNSATESHMISKIFIGFHLHPELKAQLNQSSQWKQAKIMQQNLLLGLLETHYQEKDYVGRFLIQETLTLDELRTIAKGIQELLKDHCPKYPIENLKICLFSQIFIS